MRERESAIKINNRSVIEHLSTFAHTDTYSLMYNLWLGERELILNEGKRSHDAGILYKLEGFDLAASIVERRIAMMNRQKDMDKNLEVPEEVI